MAGALEGLRVLDLTHYIAGPYATKWLADYGAEVLKIEPPVGEGGRRLGPFPGDEPDPDKSGLFAYLNTNKRGITLDLKTATGRKIVRELVAQNDVVVENFAPHVMPALGLSYEELAQVNPRIVLTSISNFGQTGPYRDYSATDFTLYAMSGMMWTNGVQGQAPFRHGLTQAQVTAGMAALSGIMTAALHQQWTGEGQWLDIAVVDSLAIILMGAAFTYSYTGSLRARDAGSDLFQNALPPTNDGYVAPVVLGGMTWDTFAAFLEMPELADERFETAAARALHVEELKALLLPKFAQMSKHELFHNAQAWRFPFGMVQDAADLAASEQLHARGFFAELDPERFPGAQFPGPAFSMSATPWEVRRPAPRLGEHNVEVLGTLGYTPQEVVHLKELGVV